MQIRKGEKYIPDTRHPFTKWICEIDGDDVLFGVFLACACGAALCHVLAGVIEVFTK